MTNFIKRLIISIFQYYSSKGKHYERSKLIAVSYAYLSIVFYFTATMILLKHFLGIPFLSKREAQLLFYIPGIVLYMFFYIHYEREKRFTVLIKEWEETKIKPMNAHLLLLYLLVSAVSVFLALFLVAGLS
jgi:hypothetical protein